MYGARVTVRARSWMSSRSDLPARRCSQERFHVRPRGPDWETLSDLGLRGPLGPPGLVFRLLPACPCEHYHTA